MPLQSRDFYGILIPVNQKARLGFLQRVAARFPAGPPACRPRCVRFACLCFLSHNLNGGCNNDVLQFTRMDADFLRPLYRSGGDHLRLEDPGRRPGLRRGLFPGGPGPAGRCHRRVPAADQPLRRAAGGPERPELGVQHGPHRLGGGLHVHPAGAGLLLPAPVSENGGHDHPLFDGGPLRQGHEDHVLPGYCGDVFHFKPAGYPVLRRGGL